MQAIRKEKLSEIIETNGGRFSSVGKMMGYKSGDYISQMIGGSRPISEKTARKFENIFNLPYLWMDNEKPILFFNNTNLKEEADLYNTNNYEVELKKLWLISWVQAGDWDHIQDAYQPDERENPVYTTEKVGSHAFALKVKGRSMESPNGIPTYPEGAIIIVDPDKPAENGSPVIVRLDNSNEATFKQLVIDGNKKYLEPLNPRYPVIEVDEDATICGVVVQTFING